VQVYRALDINVNLYSHTHTAEILEKCIFSGRSAIWWEVYGALLRMYKALTYIYIYIHINIYTYIFIYIHTCNDITQIWLHHSNLSSFTFRHITPNYCRFEIYVQPIPFGVTLSNAKLKAQSSNVSFHWNVAKETFELWVLSLRKWHPKWDWLYIVACIYTRIHMYMSSHVYILTCLYTHMYIHTHTYIFTAQILKTFYQGDKTVGCLRLRLGFKGIFQKSPKCFPKEP